MAPIKIGLSNQAIFAITLLTLLISLLLCTSFAASGGRMGGDSFSSSDQSSSSSSYSDSHHHYYHHDTNREYSSSSSNYEKSNRGNDDDGSSLLTAAVIIIFAVVAFFMFYFGAKNKESSLIMVQVGLTGKANSLQKQLNEIAKTADTSSSKGWNLILSETVLALLQHRQHFISGYATVKYHSGIQSLENNFRQLVKEERQKIDIESLVNVNNIRRQKAVICKADKLDKEYIVVTIFIAAKNTYEASTIKSIDDLKRVLQSLEFSSEELLAVEVLWTPQDENDTLSEDELLEDYPLLRPI